MPRQRPRWIVLGLALASLFGAIAWWQVSTTGRANGNTNTEARLRCDLPPEPAAARHPGMVWVPGGRLAFGDTLYPEERPVRRAAVAGFWMDRTEVTNDEFSAFVQATGYVTVAERPVDPRTHAGLPPDMLQPGAVVFVMPTQADGPRGLTQWWRYTAGASWRHPGGPRTDIRGRGAFPVVAVTYEDALAYARWRGRSLPNEMQWEWAARGGRPADAATEHTQPGAANTWQGLFPVVNSGDDGFVGLAPAGCYAPNGYGLFDMIGNAWELTADAWTPDHADTSATPSVGEAPVRPPAAAQRVIKGGSFLCAPNYCMRYRAGARQPQDEDLAASHLGFRTILQDRGP